MWTRLYSITTREITAKQMWKLFADVNNWHTWDEGIEYAKLDGAFEKGNCIHLKPKGGPEVKVELLEVAPDKGFLDVTIFPLAKMYDRHTFEETHDGLRIIDTISVEGLLSFLWIKLVTRKLADSLPGEMEKQIRVAGTL